MDNNDLITQANDSVKDTEEQHSGMVELSDEALSQVYGGTTWTQLLSGLGGFRPTWKHGPAPKPDLIGPDIPEGPVCPGWPVEPLPTLSPGDFGDERPLIVF